MKKSLFIVVEGLDGSGKTTQIELLRDYFLQRGEQCHVTAEPTDLPTGKLIRRILRKELSADPRTLAALFAADRLEHIYHPVEGLLARLREGSHVIASRYYFSSLAYQGEFVDPDWIAELNRQARQSLSADLTIFLDLEPEISMDRIRARVGEVELFETVEKLRHVRESFRQAFQRYGEGERIAIVDAGRKVEEVHKEVVRLIAESI